MKAIAKNIFLASVLSFLFGFSAFAQDTIPEWTVNKPVEKGFVYGVGIGQSSDAALAGDKARTLALSDLTNSYNLKFESLSLKCDTIFGEDNEVSQIITSLLKEQEATLKNVEEVDKLVVENDLTVVYLLVKLSVSMQIDIIQSEIDKNGDLQKNIKEEGLDKELERF